MDDPGVLPVDAVVPVKDEGDPHLMKKVAYLGAFCKGFSKGEG